MVNDDSNGKKTRLTEECAKLDHIVKRQMDSQRSKASCGGDTDTIASMVGQIVGAFLGQAKLPGDWIARLSERQMIIDIGSRFVKTVVLQQGKNNNG